MFLKGRETNKPPFFWINTCHRFLTNSSWVPNTTPGNVWSGYEGRRLSSRSMLLKLVILSGHQSHSGSSHGLLELYPISFIGTQLLPRTEIWALHLKCYTSPLSYLLSPKNMFLFFILWSLLMSRNWYTNFVCFMPGLSHMFRSWGSMVSTSEENRAHKSGLLFAWAMLFATKPSAYFPNPLNHSIKYIFLYLHYFLSSEKYIS